MNKRLFRLLIVFIIFALYPVAVHIVLILQVKFVGQELIQTQ